MRCKIFLYILLIIILIPFICSEETYVEPQILQEINHENVQVIIETTKQPNIESEQISDNFYSAKINRQELNQLLNDPNTISITEDQIATILLSDSVPLINASIVQRKQYSSTNLTGIGQTICIIDTGIDTTHTAFTGRILAQKCFCDASNLGGGGCCPDTTNEDDSATDDHGHGTHVAGIAAGNGGGIIGTAPGANIVAVKVANSAGTGLFSDITQAVNWCASNATLYNISVITISLGGYSHTANCDTNYTALTQEITNAWNNNVSVTISAGNDASTTAMSAPACISQAISVASSSKTDSIASNTNRNFFTDLFSPGVSITSALLNGGTTTLSGTSMSAPHVAGMIALLQQYKNNVENRPLSSQEINDTIATNGTTINDIAGSGRNFIRIDSDKSLIAIDLFSPALTNPNTTSQTIYIYNTIQFIANASDVNLQSLWVEGNWSGTKQNYSMSLLSNPQYNLSLTNSSFTSGQTFQWRIYANDSHNNVNTSSWFNLSILSGAPIITLYAPTNNTNTNNISTIFNFTYTDDINTTTNCYFYLNSILNQTKYATNGSVSEFSQNLSEGINIWNIACNDTNSNIGNSTLRTLIIDLTKPLFTSSTYSSLVELGDNQSFSTTITDSYLVYANMSYDNTNFTLTNSSNIFSRNFQTYTNGTNNFIIYAKDQANNLNSTSITFTVNDSVPGPRILNTIYTPSIGYNTKQNITAWILDARTISSALISINGINYTMNNNTAYNFSYNFTTSTCGTNTFKIFSNDTLNQGVTNTTTFSVINCCGDASCNNGELCSTCATDCGTCSTTSTSGGGGGGGGVPRITTINNESIKIQAPEIVIPEATKKITKTISKASPENPISFSIPENGIPITDIQIFVNQELTNVEVSVEKLESKPTELETAPDVVYEYLEFQNTNLDNTQITNADLSFSVSKEWINNNGIDKYSIKLNRYTTQWDELQTEYASENENNVYYTATAPGFSYFSITGKTIQETLKDQPLEETKIINNYKTIIISILVVLVILGLILFLIHEHKEQSLKRN